MRIVYHVDEDPNGVSLVVRSEPIGAGATTPLRVDQASLATAPARYGSSDLVDVDVKPGEVVAVICHFEAGKNDPMHRTNTIDFATVVSGEMTMVLSSEMVRLVPGDCVVMNGCDHGWNPGPAGCVMSFVMVGMYFA